MLKTCSSFFIRENAEYPYFQQTVKFGDNLVVSRIIPKQPLFLEIIPTKQFEKCKVEKGGSSIEREPKSQKWNSSVRHVRNYGEWEEQIL